jgi:hypothetical protein
MCCVHRNKTISFILKKLNFDPSTDKILVNYGSRSQMCYKNTKTKEVDDPIKKCKIIYS